MYQSSELTLLIKFRCMIRVIPVRLATAVGRDVMPRSERNENLYTVSCIYFFHSFSFQDTHHLSPLLLCQKLFCKPATVLV